ncbi:hypothetical protein P9B03_13470 [Metasolibacillus meyeri]|uniref:Bacterial CdiA-CT RNAse A domain-containing protein n=1 Tax=Metasolibacillus meyeri TaxID=1071052 RepID=A0AAW9NT72_9BACL|nr:RNase A-like domain-containing protein [Metasolibacillus meyeri]MEC1179502.1 hypothetical protein [Metasolibacillus meyeri]
MSTNDAPSKTKVTSNNNLVKAKNGKVEVNNGTIKVNNGSRTQTMSAEQFLKLQQAQGASVDSKGKHIFTLESQRNILSKPSDAMAPYAKLGYHLFVEDFVTMANSEATIGEHIGATVSSLNPLRKIGKTTKVLEGIGEAKNITNKTNIPEISKSDIGKLADYVRGTTKNQSTPVNKQQPSSQGIQKTEQGLTKGTGNVKSEDKSSPILSGGLSAHELKGGHLIERHVGKTDEELLERLKSNSKISGFSTFKDIATVEQVANTVLNDPKNIKKIEKWLSNPDSKPTLLLKYTIDGEIIGRSVSKGSEVVEDVTKARIVLKKDKEGSFILTGYPEK